MIEAGLILALLSTILSSAWLLDRRDRRMHEERHAWSLERTGLLQRIQAPELAVAQAVQVRGFDPPAVNPHVDEEYWEAQEEAMRKIAEYEREGLN